MYSGTDTVLYTLPTFLTPAPVHSSSYIRKAVILTYSYRRTPYSRDWCMGFVADQLTSSWHAVSIGVGAWHVATRVAAAVAAEAMATW